MDRPHGAPRKPAPMNPRRVLITRPEPGATETAARIAALGFAPIVAPLLEIRPLPVRLPPPERIAAILLTSGGAVAPLPASYHGRPVLAVGDATARRAREAGFAHASSAEGDAEALAALARTRFAPKDGTLLLASGRGQGQALAATLRAAGYRVARRVVYWAAPVPRLPPMVAAALMDPHMNTVMFFSAETARRFLILVRAAGLLDRLRDREAITIGRQAAMALEEAPWSRVRVASHPTQDEMLALLR